MQGHIINSAPYLFFPQLPSVGHHMKPAVVVSKTRLKQGFADLSPCQPLPLLTCLHTSTSSSELHRQQLYANLMLLPKSPTG